MTFVGVFRVGCYNAETSALCFWIDGFLVFEVLSYFGVFCMLGVIAFILMWFGYFGDFVYFGGVGLVWVLFDG